MFFVIIMSKDDTFILFHLQSFLHTTAKPFDFDFMSLLSLLFNQPIFFEDKDWVCIGIHEFVRCDPSLTQTVSSPILLTLPTVYTFLSFPECLPLPYSFILYIFMTSVLLLKFTLDITYSGNIYYPFQYHQQAWTSYSSLSLPINFTVFLNFSCSKRQ